MQTIERIKILLVDTLGLGAHTGTLRAESALLGSIPELDSVAVIQIITELEEHFDIQIDDDEIDESLFHTVGGLSAFVEQKLER
ncbi:MAG TPA: phosphopantetheine-binding protein [Herbaspirillum sp.]|jgi:acyl carrier protein|nr:phosphopantetheine-binding protein [Herbaspirillum sp.]